MTVCIRNINKTECSIHKLDFNEWWIESGLWFDVGWLVDKWCIPKESFPFIFEIQIFERIVYWQRRVLQVFMRSSLVFTGMEGGKIIYPCCMNTSEAYTTFAPTLYTPLYVENKISTYIICKVIGNITLRGCLILKNI